MRLARRPFQHQAGSAKLLSAGRRSERRRIAKPARGEVWWFDIGATASAEINGNPWRAFIIISTDDVNDHRMTVVGVPITTGGSGIPPLNIPITSSERPSLAVIDQIRALDKKRLGKPMCALSAAEMKAVEDALREVLEL